MHVLMQLGLPRRAGFALAALLAFPVALAEDPTQGKDYTVLQSASCIAPTASTVEVVEVFAYSCIHCYRLEQSIKGWTESLPAGVTYYKVPVTWGQEEPLARLYWSMKTVGEASFANDMAIFREIHVRRSPFSSDQHTAAIAQRIGLDAKRLARAGKSFLVNSRLKRGTNLVRSWRVTGTPAFVVAGKYRVASTRENLLSQAKVLEVVRWLAQRELDAGRTGCQDSG